MRNLWMQIIKNADIMHKLSKYIHVHSTDFKPKHAHKGVHFESLWTDLFPDVEMGEIGPTKSIDT